MKKLLSDDIVQLILDNIYGMNYMDILTIIDNEEVFLKEEKTLDEKQSIYSFKGTLLAPSYNRNYTLVVKNAEIPINYKIKELGTIFDNNKAYLQKLIKQYSKFSRKVYISVNEIKSHLEDGYQVYYDGTDGVSVFNVTNDSKFTIDDIFELKFYVIK